VPAERVTLLRQAYLTMLHDRDVLADAKKTGIEIEPVSGEDMDRMLKRLYASPPDIVRKARELAGRG
jgi:hypothetical protein